MRRLNLGALEGRTFLSFTRRELAAYLLRPHPTWNRRRRWRQITRWLRLRAQVRSSLPGDWLQMFTSDVYLWVQDCRHNGLVCIPVDGRWLRGPLCRIGGLDSLEQVITDGQYIAAGGQRLRIIKPGPGFYSWSNLQGANRIDKRLYQPRLVTEAFGSSKTAG